MDGLISADDKVKQGKARQGTEISRLCKVLTSMNNLSTMKIGQSIHDTLSHLAQDFLARAAPQFAHFLVNAVQTSALAELHGNRDGPRRLVHERPVVATDVV